jgi:hypothetical protein
LLHLGDASRAIRPGFHTGLPPPGFFKDLPSVDILWCVHSHATRTLRFGPTLPHALLVPPSWFLTTLTAYPAPETASLLHPAADHGVHQVSGTADAAASSVSPSSLMPHPPEPSPREQPCPTSPQAVSPLTLSVATPTRLRGFPPLPSPLLDAPVSGDLSPVALMGFPTWSHTPAVPLHVMDKPPHVCCFLPK